MTTLHDGLVAAAAGVGAVVTLGGAAWWLIWPRVEDKLEQVAKGVRRVEQQTASDAPDTLSRHARVAAGAASEISEVRTQLQAVAARQVEADEWRARTDRRLGIVEESVVVLLTDELKNRLRD